MQKRVQFLETSVTNKTKIHTDNSSTKFKRCYFTAAPDTVAHTKIDMHTKTSEQTRAQQHLAPIALQGRDNTSVEMMAIVDSASEISAISENVLRQLGLQNELFPIHHTDTQHLQAIDGSLIQRKGRVQTTIRCGRHTRRFTFDVIDSEDPAIIGCDLMPQLGIYIANIPTDFPAAEGAAMEKTEASTMEDELRERPAPWSAHDGPDDTERAVLASHIDTLIDDNKHIGPATPEPVTTSDTWT